MLFSQVVGSEGGRPQVGSEGVSAPVWSAGRSLVPWAPGCQVWASAASL